MKINVDESGNTITIIPASTYTIKIKKVQISGKDAFILECGYDTVKYCHDLIEVLNCINKEFLSFVTNHSQDIIDYIELKHLGNLPDDKQVDSMCTLFYRWFLKERADK